MSHFIAVSKKENNKRQTNLKAEDPRASIYLYYFVMGCEVQKIHRPANSPNVLLSYFIFAEIYRHTYTQAQTNEEFD